MNNSDYDKLKEFTNSLRRIDKKFKLFALLNRAKEEYEKNNYSECIADCQKVLKDNPENAIALRGIGCSYQALNNIDEALKYYLLALEKSQEKEIEYTLIGTVYYLENKLEKAIEYFNKAIDINDSYDMAYEGRNQSMLERHLQIVDLQDDLIKRKIF